MKFFKNFTLKIVKKNLFYKGSPPNIILIEITKLFLLLFGVCVCVYITYQIKKMCVYVYVGVVLKSILELSCNLALSNKNF